ncbi:AsmA family protein [soil metagenome]
MTPVFRLRWGERSLLARIGLALGGSLAALLLALLLLVLFFDWTWTRPAIQHQVMAWSGRSIDFDKLKLGLSAELEPTLEFDGLRIQNAPWAAERPFVEAGVVRMAFAWRSLDGPLVIITRLTLVDANIDMERQADGLRNWRLSRPLDRGPGRVRVLSVDATRSEVRFVDGGLALDVDARMSPLAGTAPSTATAQQTASGGPPLVKQFDFKGTRHGQAFAGTAAVSQVLTFWETGTPFAMRGHVESGASRLEIDGTATDLAHLHQLDVNAHLVVTRPADLSALIPMLLWPALAIDATARVQKHGGHWQASQIVGTLGKTDVAGEASFEERVDSTKRATFSAKLSSAVLHGNDLRAMSTGHLGGSRQFEALRTWDGDAQLQVGRIDDASLRWLQSLSLTARLRDGQLSVEPFELGIAGGRITGSLQMAAGDSPADVRLEASAAGLRIARFHAAASGELQGQASLRARGDSPKALLEALSGKVRLALHGARIPRALDAKLALDGGAMLSAFLAGAETVPVPCAAAEFDFDKGRGRTRLLAFETERTLVTGEGVVSLPDRSVDLLLSPHRKTSSLLALDRSIRLRGPVAHPAVTLADASNAKAPARCPDLRF